jgi:hypothetical protein
VDEKEKEILHRGDGVYIPNMSVDALIFPPAQTV